MGWIGFYNQFNGEGYLQILRTVEQVVQKFNKAIKRFYHRSPYTYNININFTIGWSQIHSNINYFIRCKFNPTKD